MSANTPAFPQHGFTSSPEVAARMADKGGMTMRQYYKAAALPAFKLLDDGQFSPDGKKIGEDKQHAKWVAGACGRYADAMLREDEEHAKK